MSKREADLAMEALGVWKGSFEESLPREAIEGLVRVVLRHQGSSVELSSLIDLLEELAVSAMSLADLLGVAEKFVSASKSRPIVVSFSEPIYTEASEL